MIIIIPTHKNHIIYHCISNYIYIEPFNYLISIIVGRRINPSIQYLHNAIMQSTIVNEQQ